MTACEIKYGSRPVGVEVLIVKEPVSQELARRMYFYRIIRADELFQ